MRVVGLLRLQHRVKRMVTYILDVLVLTAVDVTAGAAITESTVQDIAEGQEAAVAIVLADDLLVTLADLGLAVAGHDKSNEAQSSEDGLDEHVDGLLKQLAGLVQKRW